MKEFYKNRFVIRSAPSFAESVAKRKQGDKPAGNRISKDCHQNADTFAAYETHLFRA
jgi:hypothetical protein